MNDEIKSAAAEVAVRQPTIAEAAVAMFAPHEAAARTLAERYRGVVWDVAEPRGMREAKAARLELREQGRFAIQRMRDRAKDQLNDAKRTVEAEATRLIAIVEPIEQAVHQQITAHEERLAAERAERERVEAERRRVHEDAIAAIVGYATQARGQPIERIEQGLAAIRDLDVSPAVFEEFAPRAAEAQRDTIERLENLIADIRRREAEAKAAAAAAAEAEARRLELARIAAEQAERQRLLDEQAAELARQRREIEDAALRARVQAREKELARRALDEQAAEFERRAEENRAEARARAMNEVAVQTVFEQNPAAQAPALSAPQSAPAEVPPAAQPDNLQTTDERLLASCLERIVAYICAELDQTREPPSPAWWDGLHQRINRLQSQLWNRLHRSEP